jgi:hypothetical protein
MLEIAICASSRLWCKIAMSGYDAPDTIDVRKARLPPVVGKE